LLVAVVLAFAFPYELREPDSWAYRYAAENFTDGKLTHKLPLGAQDLLRGFIAPTGRQVGGAFDVREQDGDGAFGKLLSHDS
jgi:hypothetical protein